MLPRFYVDVLEGEPSLIPNASRRRRITGAIFREDQSERGNTQSSRERHSWGRPTPRGARQARRAPTWQPSPRTIAGAIGRMTERSPCTSGACSSSSRLGGWSAGKP